MLERSARLPLDHLRGMSPEAVADATLRAIEKDKAEITLTFRGKLLLLVNRFAPWVIELVARKKIRRLFAAEIAARERARAS
jgi:short-subunit dehydrogenase